MSIRLGWLPLLFGIVWLNQAVFAAVLPEDRADALYHSYDGGGVEVTGPSILVRKQFGASTSMFANYYVDMVSSASIDVVTTASPYTEERTEQSIGIDYLHGKTNMSLSYTNSEESDYTANSAHFSLSQDMFGDLTTVTMGFSQGWDEVRNNNIPSFKEDVDRKNYRLGLTQILSKNLITGIGWETITDQGFLRNPYRQVRKLSVANDPSGGDELELENYPSTRTSNALALRGRYFLPYRAALRAEYKFFEDSWGIAANTFEIGYTHPKGKWIYDAKLRFYSQTGADFYSDLFPTPVINQNFFARDKELSTYDSFTLGVGFSYEFDKGGWDFIDKGSLNFSWDYITFNYEDFLDRRESQAMGSTVNPGEESPYSFSTNVLQFYISIWY